MGKRGRTPKIYALYKDEQNITDGTLREIAEKRGIKLQTLWWMLSPAYRRRVNKLSRRCGGRLELVEIPDADKEETENVSTTKNAPGGAGGCAKADKKTRCTKNKIGGSRKAYC